MKSDNDGRLLATTRASSAGRSPRGGVSNSERSPAGSGRLIKIIRGHCLPLFDTLDFMRLASLLAVAPSLVGRLGIDADRRVRCGSRGGSWRFSPVHPLPLLWAVYFFQSGRRDKTLKRVDFSADSARNRRFGGRFSVRFGACYAGFGGIYGGR